MTPRPPSPPARAGASALPSWRELKAIADGQRQVLLALLAGILAIPGASALSAAGESLGLGATEVLVITVVVVVLGIRGWMAVATYRLARAQGSKVAVLWAFGGFLPNLIGLIVLVVLSGRATGRLKKSGIKVGLLGAKLGEQPPPGFLCKELEQDFA